MKRIKAFNKWCETNLPAVWGTLWSIVVTVGSLSLALWTIKMLFKVIGLI